MPQGFGQKPTAGVFFDTDFSTIDSLLAVSLIHGLQGKDDCRMAIVTVSRPNLAVVSFADAVERFYRGPAGNFSQVPPIGMITTGAAGETSPAYVVPFQKKKADGTPVYPNEVHSVIDTGDPNTLIRNYLEAQYDQNAFFVLGGPATNLANALAFPGMRELIAAKARYLVMVAGVFPEGAAERKVLAEWPTPIVTVGREVGTSLPFPGASIDKEFAAAVPDNPVADAYRAYHAMPYDAPSWAMAAVLYAARPKEGYFQVSGSDSRRRQLVYDPAQKDRILQAYMELASAKPVRRMRFRPPDAAPIKE